MISGGLGELEVDYGYKSTDQVVSDLEERNHILSNKVGELETRLSKIEDCFSKEGTPEQKLKCLEEATRRPETKEGEQERKDSLRAKAIRLGPLMFENEGRAKKRAEELTKILNYLFKAQFDSWEKRWVVTPE